MARKNKLVDEINCCIGQTIKELRIKAGMSAQYLAQMLNITHQQLHKYECGANKVSAGRLALIAKILGVDIGIFYENQDVKKQTVKLSPTQKKYMEVFTNFMQLSNPEYQKAIYALVKSLNKENK